MPFDGIGKARDYSQQPELVDLDQVFGRGNIRNSQKPPRPPTEPPEREDDGDWPTWNKRSLFRLAALTLTSASGVALSVMAGWDKLSFFSSAFCVTSFCAYVCAIEVLTDKAQEASLQKPAFQAKNVATQKQIVSDATIFAVERGALYAFGLSALVMVAEFEAGKWARAIEHLRTPLHSDTATHPAALKNNFPTELWAQRPQPMNCAAYMGQVICK